MTNLMVFNHMGDSVMSLAAFATPNLL